MDIKANYVGITRRVIAGVIDCVIMLGITPLLCFLLMAIFSVAFENNELGRDSLEMAADFLKSSQLLLTFITLIFFMTLEILMITRFSGTPGQLLCVIHIKDANTLENITIMQAAIRCIFRDIVTKTILFLAEYSFMWFTALLIAVTFAIFDRRKQFFHDKIARTVAINHPPTYLF